MVCLSKWILTLTNFTWLLWISLIISLTRHDFMTVLFILMYLFIFFLMSPYSLKCVSLLMPTSIESLSTTAFWNTKGPRHILSNIWATLLFSYLVLSVFQLLVYDFYLYSGFYMSFLPKTGVSWVLF